MRGSRSGSPLTSELEPHVLVVYPAVHPLPSQLRLRDQVVKHRTGERPSPSLSSKLLFSDFFPGILFSLARIDSDMGM